MKPSISLAIIDDHPLIREGVSRSLAETGNFNIWAKEPRPPMP